MRTKLIIKEVCAQKGISLTELASRIPSKKEGKTISKSTLSEKINDGRMSLSSLDSIATALGVSVRDLIAQDDEQTTPLICPKCGKPLICKECGHEVRFSK